MPKAFAAAVVATLALVLAACSNDSGPVIKFTGGSFIFNYRLATAMAGVLFITERKLPDGTTVEVTFPDPAGGAPLVQSQKIAAGEDAFDFRFEELHGIRKGVDYVAVVRLIGPDGVEIERLERVYKSDIDQEGTMPEKPLTVGPGYTRNPESQ